MFNFKQENEILDTMAESGLFTDIQIRITETALKMNKIQEEMLYESVLLRSGKCDDSFYKLKYQKDKK